MRLPVLGRLWALEPLENGGDREVVGGVLSIYVGVNDLRLQNGRRTCLYQDVIDLRSVLIAAEAAAGP